MDPSIAAKTALDHAFERKVRASGRAIIAERAWLRLWALIGVAGLFLALSFAGVWPRLPYLAHVGLLAAFGLAGLAAIVYAMLVPRPSRDEAVRRIERTSGVPHRPASSYEDTLSAKSADPATEAIWQAHRSRLALLLSRLKVGPPKPDTHRHDPMAFRILGALSLLLFAGLLGDSASDRVRAAFRLGPPGLASDARLDAWVTPPAYTAKPPIMLADGQRPGVSLARDDGRPFEVPIHSMLVMRATGTGGGQIVATFVPDGVAPKDMVPQKLTSAPVAGVDGVAELKIDIKQSGSLSVPGQTKPWVFSVIPDRPPTITLLKEPDATQRGSMKLNYKVEDDYGVVSAEARFKRLPEDKGDERTAWARSDVVKGPRPPFERVPKFPLRLPQLGAGAAGKPGEALTYLELGAHPWAGLRVRMTLQAKDAAGQIGNSEPRDIVMPARRFTKPLARAIVEQRRKLIADPRNRTQVLKGLAALMIAPEGFIDTHAYLGMKTASVRLQRDKSRAAMKSVVDQLWHVALRLEDGNLSDAERRLKDAQDKLAKALDDGASEEEIEKLMKELRQAMNDYVEQLAKQNEGQENEKADGDTEDKQQLGQNDLEQMMRKMEQAAKNGSREQAQQMLSEMRDLMDRLQAQKSGEKGDREASRQMQKKMDELGNMIGQQQKLMDDTFSEMKKQGDKGPNGNKQGQKGAQGKGKPGEKGQGQANKGEKGKGQPGQKGEKGGQGEKDGEQGSGESGDAAENGEAGDTPGEGLRQRQKKLAEQLDKLKKELKGATGSGSKEMDAANEAMEDAERSLQEGALDDATQQQGDALDKMRQGAQQMQQEMAKNGRNRFGENGETPRDPLGRPQKSQGPDAGASVKVPGEIDMQRAREILQELRKRSAEQTRPPVELDYLERLLKRF